MVKENLLPNPDLLHSLLFFKALLSSPVRYLQNSSVSELPAYQLCSLRATPYEHKRVMFGERPGSIGKLINLELGTASSLDTHYELVIGKFPRYKDRKGENVDSYRGIYFIINFHERKMETFRHPCFEADIQAAFSYKFDCFRITNWLNSIKNLDDFIYDDTYNVEFFLSEEEHEKRRREIMGESDTHSK